MQLAASSARRARGTSYRFTFEPGDETNPVWYPDGARIAYSNQHGSAPTLIWRAVDSHGEAVQILTAGNPRYPSSFSPDGKTLAFTEIDSKTGTDIWVVSLDGQRQLIRFSRPLSKSIRLSFRRMDSGSLITRMNRGRSKSTRHIFRMEAPRRRSQPTAALSPCGPPMAANSSIATSTG